MGDEQLYDQNLALTQAGGESTLALKLLNLLLEQLPEVQIGLELALEADNRESIREICHGFAGASSYCGVPQLTECAKMIEQEADATITAKTTQLLDLLSQLQKQHQ